MNIRVSGGWTACLAGLCCAAASAQSVTFLTPDKYTASLHESVALRVGQSDGPRFAAVDWPAGRVHWLFVRSGDAQQNLADPRPKRAADNFLTVTLDHPGATVIGLDKQPSVEKLAGRNLKAFVRRHIAPDSLAAAARDLSDDAVVRVRRIESAKTIIRVFDPAGGAPLHSAVAQSKTGQKVEIRLMADPTLLAVGSDLPIRTYVDASKIGGVRVRATCVESGVVHETTADRSGFAYFRITHAGLWRIEFHHARLSEHDADADWTVYSATATFEVPVTGAGK